MGETQKSLIRKLELSFSKAWIIIPISKMHLQNERLLKHQFEEVRKWFQNVLD